MKTFEVVHAQTGTVLQTLQADYYKELWDFHFYVKTKWYQRAKEVGRFPWFNNIVIKEENESTNLR